VSTSTASQTDHQLVLVAKHQAELLARAIPLDFAIASGLRSVNLADLKRRKEQGVKLSWPSLPLHPVTGILMEYQRCLDGVPRCRVRSDTTEYTVPGPIDGSHHGEETVKVPRYICQAEVGVVPYLPKEVFDVASDVSKPVFITEAPLKALCLCAHGLPAIGLGGVLAGAHDSKALEGLREVVAHAELRRIKWGGRTAFVVFDAGLSDHDDHPGNPMVALGAAYVAKALSDLGADVRVVRVPYFHSQDSEPVEGKFWRATDQGPDDLVARAGIDAFRALIADAIAADPARRMTKALLDDGLAPVDRPKKAGDLLRELFFQAMLYVGGDTVTAAVAAITSTRAGIGKKALKEAAQEFKERLVRRLKKDEPEWMSKLECSASGTPRPLRENVEHALRNDGGLAGLVAFNEFTQTVVFNRTPPWVEQYEAARNTKLGDPWTDHDDIRLSGYLAARFRILDLPHHKVRAAVTVVARDKTIHPIRDYLQKVQWDGVNRIDAWLVDLFGVEDSSYARNVGRWWLLSAVARIMRPGAKVDHTLVFEGEQGIAKSSALRILGGDAFSDGDLGDLRSKEAALALQGVWIVELPEGEIFSRATTRQLKAFVTKDFDDIVPKFSNDRRRILRQCVFALTTNDTADYLTDPTGNRRFWPVRCTVVDLDGLRAARDQLWAEAVALFQQGEKWWPSTEEEKALCQAEQTDRLAHDAWEEKIGRGLRRAAHTTVGDVLDDILDIATDKQGQREARRVTACLRALGWVESGSRKEARRWTRGPNADPMIVTETVTKEELDALVRKGEHIRLVHHDDDAGPSLDDETFHGVAHPAAGV
jgi:predicted P-loop ATPase